MLPPHQARKENAYSFNGGQGELGGQGPLLGIFLTGCVHSWALKSLKKIIRLLPAEWVHDPLSSLAFLLVTFFF
jgi:hypothetical protein